MGFLLSVICSRGPIEFDKPHILALAAETDILLFKEQVPLKFKKYISAVQCERKTFQFISLSTPVSFRWTVLFIFDAFSFFENVCVKTRVRFSVLARLT
jgi:hypothetical protein